MVRHFYPYYTISAQRPQRWWQFFGANHKNLARWPVAPRSNGDFSHTTDYTGDALKSRILEVFEDKFKSAENANAFRTLYAIIVDGSTGESHLAYQILATSQGRFQHAMTDSLRAFNRLVVHYGSLKGLSQDDLNDLIAGSTVRTGPSRNFK